MADGSTVSYITWHLSCLESQRVDQTEVRSSFPMRGHNLLRKTNALKTEYGRHVIITW